MMNKKEKSCELPVRNPRSFDITIIVSLSLFAKIKATNQQYLLSLDDNHLKYGED